MGRPAPPRSIPAGPVLHHLPAPLVAIWRRLRRAYLVACRQATGHASDLPAYEKEGTPFGACAARAAVFASAFIRSLYGAGSAGAQRLSHAAHELSSGGSSSHQAPFTYGLGAGMTGRDEAPYVVAASGSSMSVKGDLRRRQ